MDKKIKFDNLSIIIPLYNESHRTKFTFEIIKEFIKKNKIKLEIIFVNDGSTDDSLIKIRKFLSTIKKKKIKYHLITYKKNMGKGYALICGIKKSVNKWILTCDFDMAVLPSTVFEWTSKGYIQNNNFAYFGSRLLKKSKVETIWIRMIYGFFFTLLIKILFGIKIKDTQCGFKLYNASYIKKIVSKLKSFRYVHDVEIINKLMQKKITIIELPLKWTHIEGSKVNLLKDPIQMIVDLIKIKIRSFYKA